MPQVSQSQQGKRRGYEQYSMQYQQYPQPYGNQYGNQYGYQQQYGQPTMAGQPRPYNQPAIRCSSMGVQMSPGHNQVSSTTDVKECQTDMMEADMLDNLSSISMPSIENNVVLSPTQLMARSVSQNSSRMGSQASYLQDTSNMVVNDMSSVLNQLAQENHYLSLS